MFGLGNMGGQSEWIWILILLLFGGCSNGCNNGCDNGTDMTFLILILLLCGGLGNTGTSGCGCGNNCGCLR